MQLVFTCIFTKPDISYNKIVDALHVYLLMIRLSLGSGQYSIESTYIIMLNGEVVVVSIVSYST